MADIAILGFWLFVALAFGLRSVVHYRRTGRTGFVGLSGAPGSMEWVGGALFAVALVTGGAAPVLQRAGVVEPLAVLDGRVTHVAGITLYALGLAGTLWAQFAMGDSWRIGVDAGARTALVAAGPFRWVRNPIFTAMLVATLGLVLLVPNVVALGALAILVAALEIQVRLVEEPYLVGVHSAHYRAYAARTGRFVPGLGRHV